jgi:hypothetical protein
MVSKLREQPKRQTKMTKYQATIKLLAVKDSGFWKKAGNEVIKEAIKAVRNGARPEDAAKAIH